jgi:hypothetical protein
MTDIITVLRRDPVFMYLLTAFVVFLLVGLADRATGRIK